MEIAELTFEDVKKFLEIKKDDAEVVQYIRTLVPESLPTTEQVNQFLGTSEGKLLIQPLMDKRVTEAIDTFKKKTFESEVQARVAAEMLKRNPEETPEQKRIRELEENMRRQEEERTQERLKSQIKDLAFKEAIPLDFVEDIPFGSPEQASLYFRRFKQQIEDAKTAKVNELLANGFKPGAGAQKESNGKRDLSKLSEKELVELEMAGELDKELGGS